MNNDSQDKSGFSAPAMLAVFNAGSVIMAFIVFVVTSISEHRINATIFKLINIGLPTLTIVSIYFTWFLPSNRLGEYSAYAAFAPIAVAALILASLP